MITKLAHGQIQMILLRSFYQHTHNLPHPTEGHPIGKKNLLILLTFQIGKHLSFINIPCYNLET